MAPHEARLLEELRRRIARGIASGVTLTGNRLTMRWRVGEELVHIHAVIIEAMGTEAEERTEEVES